MNRRLSRLILIALVALALSPGTFLRTPVEMGLDHPIRLSKVEEPGASPPLGWSVEGVWEYKGEGLLFGGYSALLALEGSRMLAFSDRGGRFTFLQPDQPQGPKPEAAREIAEQRVDPVPDLNLADIESAVRDPVTQQYWLAYENAHVIQRHNADHEGNGLRLLMDAVDWPDNAGAEAMVRLSDGGFLVISEGGDESLYFPSDPVDGAPFTRVAYDPPPGDFSITDAVQLPDRRLALLLRKVAKGVPPFEARIALADWPSSPPEPGEPLVLAPDMALDLTSLVPPENYEGLAVREREDGALDLWVLSDDNLSIMQRTLLVKLRFDPVAAGAQEEAATPPDAEKLKQKARD